MYVYIDSTGTLREIITERVFRSGDSVRDKIYVYYDNTSLITEAWIKYKLPDGTLTTETTFSVTKVGKELPSDPLRNLSYFNYDHTYEDALGVTHVGYEFYEIEVPDTVLGSATTSANTVIASIRFVIDGGTSMDNIGAIPFSVESSMGIITDESINISEYNYLLSVFSSAVSGATWGNISGSITNQTDLVNYVTYKVDAETTRAETVEATKQDDMKLSIVDGKINITWEE